MPSKGNQQIPNVHLRKQWQNYVKTWFDQSGRKKRRREARKAKAIRVFPRPLGLLRPVVHAPTIRYNAKIRAGRGFTLEELKAAGVNSLVARTIGIAVDHRRRNRSDISLRANVQRLKEYKAKLVLFPKNPKKPQQGEASPSEKVSQLQGEVLPVQAPRYRQDTVPVSAIDKNFNAYAALRKARTDARLVGVREKKKKEKAEKEAAAAKKGGAD